MLYANPAMQVLSGYADDELIGATPRLLQGADTDRAVLAEIRAALVAGASFKGEGVNYRKDGSRYVVDWTIDPIRDAAGTITAWLSVQRDVTAQRAEALRAADHATRLDAIFAYASVGLSVIGSDGAFLSVNQELCRILGRSETDLLGCTVVDVTHPDDLPASRRALAHAITARQPAVLDKRYVRPNGELIWANSTVTPMADVHDRPGHLLVVTVDLTQRLSIERALQESETRFRQFGDASSNALWVREATTLRLEYASAAFAPLYGLPPGGEEAPPWSTLVVAEDRAVAFEAIRRATAGEQRTCTYRIRRPDGELRWIHDTVFALSSGGELVERIGGISVDVTDAITNSERLEMLVAELQHRTRNLINLVRSIADRTARSSRDLPDFRARFIDRLDALARVQKLLSRLQDVDRVCFDELLRGELSVIAGVSDRIVLDGPAGIRLRSSSVQMVAMALHELATNAVKYGALGQPQAHLTVRWSLVTAADGAPRLSIVWRESAVVMPADPSATAQGSGQGRDLIERALPYQLDAETRFVLETDGLLCTIELPVSTTPPSS
ncbi:PAS domain S-box protein [Sphingomonas sp. RIT328]|uniref:PAS domain-containing sensor histidine kinase n=1 Tax=Sphingomonas sp. RIT328 TaxID=1470591 RepID=UPI0022854D2C